MSYDTTVHDAIDPPPPRLRTAAAPEKTVVGRMGLRKFWHAAAWACVSLGILLLVTWLVARLMPWESPPPVHLPAIHLDSGS